MKYLPIILLLFIPASAFGQARGVSYDRDSLVVIQSNLKQTFATITNSAATASTIAAYDVNKKLGSATSTGSGTVVVLQNSPTITTPSIGSFVNATHGHQDAAGGGQLFPASSTNNNLPRFSGAGGNLLKDSSVNVDDSGNVQTPGEVAVGVGSAVAGRFRAQEGTAPSLVADAFSIYSPTDVAAGGLAFVLPGAAATGFLLATDAAGVMTITLVSFTGTGSVVRDTSPTVTTPTFTGIAVWQDNVRQTFNPGADAAGINVGSQAGDPGTPTNGDLWYDSVANELTARINGANVALGAGGGSAVYVNATEVTNPNFQTNSALKYTVSASTNVIIDLNDDDKTLTDAATIATDCSVGMNFSVTITDNRTLGAPTNGKPGRFYSWEVIQDATGNRLLTLATNFIFGTDITGITLSTNGGYRDYIRAKCRTDNTNVFAVVGFVRGYQ